MRKHTRLLLPVLAAAMLQPMIFAKAGGEPADKPWFNMKAEGADSSKTITIYIYDDIGGWGISAADFISALSALDDGKCNVLVAIDSDGGDVFAGFAISNALRRMGSRCTARIDGLAASAASVIACGAHRVVMQANTQMMIHNPWTWAAGDSEDLRKTADVLDKVRDGLVATYRAKAPTLDADNLVQLLNDETWLSPGEAIALGLADEIQGVGEIKARIRSPVMASYRKAPAAFLDNGSPPVVPPPPPPPAPAGAAAALASRIHAACKDAGMPAIAEVLIMTSQLKDDATVDSEITRAKAIQTLCLAAKFPELASDYIKAGLAEDAVRGRLFDKLITDDARIGNIDNKQPFEEKPPTGVKAANPTQVYANRRKSSTENAGKSTAGKAKKGSTK